MDFGILKARCNASNAHYLLVQWSLVLRYPVEAVSNVPENENQKVN